VGLGPRVRILLPPAAGHANFRSLSGGVISVAISLQKSAVSHNPVKGVEKLHETPKKALFARRAIPLREPQTSINSSRSPSVMPAASGGMDSKVRFRDARGADRRRRQRSSGSGHGPALSLPPRMQQVNDNIAKPIATLYAKYQADLKANCE
jgi:hypothetical protein